MKKKKQRHSTDSKSNQLSFDFNVNQPIEIHKPKSDVSTLKSELVWEKRPIIEVVKS